MPKRKNEGDEPEEVAAGDESFSREIPVETGAPRPSRRVATRRPEPKPKAPEPEPVAKGSGGTFTKRGGKLYPR